jgi:hypothetical protein
MDPQYALPPELSQAHRFCASVFYPSNLPATNSLFLDLPDLTPSDTRPFFPSDILTNRLFQDTPSPHIYAPSEGDLSSDAQGNSALFATGLETIQDMLDKIRWRVFVHLPRHQKPEAELVVVCNRLPNRYRRSTTPFPKLNSVALKVGYWSMNFFR